VGHGDPGGRGYGHRGRHPGDHLDGNPVGRTVDRLLTASAEDERVAALEPDDVAAKPGVLDEDLVDPHLRNRVVTGRFADVDDLHVRAQRVEQVARSEPVGDDDVRGGEQLAAADGDQSWVAGTAADEGDAAELRTRLGPRVSAADRQQPAVEPREDRVADRRRPSRVTPAGDRHGDPLGHGPVRAPGHRGGPHARGVGVVGPDTPDAVRLARRRDHGVDRRRVGRRVHQPGRLRFENVTRLEPPLPPAEPSSAGRLTDLAAGVGSDDVDGRSGGQPRPQRRPAAPPAEAWRGIPECRPRGLLQRWAGRRGTTDGRSGGQNSGSPAMALGRGPSSAMPAARVVPSASSTSRKAPVRRRSA